MSELSARLAPRVLPGKSRPCVAVEANGRKLGRTIGTCALTSGLFVDRDFLWLAFDQARPRGLVAIQVFNREVVGQGSLCHRTQTPGAQLGGLGMSVGAT